MQNIIIISIVVILDAEVTSGACQVYMPGQYGRTIDLKKIDSYAGLRRTLDILFNLRGQLDDKSTGWKLVYKDHENDILLVGDDPWEYVHNTTQFSIGFMKWKDV